MAVIRLLPISPSFFLNKGFLDLVESSEDRKRREQRERERSNLVEIERGSEERIQSRPHEKGNG